MGDVLVVNAGSTGLKLRLVAPDESSRAIGSLAEADASELDAVAHRVVHGGRRFRDPVVIDDAVRDEILALESLAPLHNAPALRAIERSAGLFADVPEVAVFDTGFHASIPDEASLYAVPTRWRDEWGIRRYGFHGLSLAWCAERVPRVLDSARAARRLVVCHLGGGCSVSAIVDGRSVDTTMGFTPLEGVPMVTRAGSVDPGALVYLLREHGLAADALDRALNLESGLAALGGTADFPELERRALAGDARAGLALKVFVHRLAVAVAGMAASAGGLDALVFTAGIGEGSALIRERLCERLVFLGVELDPQANGEAIPDVDVATRASTVRVLVIAAREDIVAARAARRVLDRSAA